MATSLRLKLQPRAKPLSLHKQNPRFSSSSSSENPPHQNDAVSESAEPLNDTVPSSSTFSYIKSRLKQAQPARPFTPPHRPAQSQPPSKVATLDEIRKNLSEFRLRSGAPPPPSSSFGDRSQKAPHVSFQELYKKSAEGNQGSSGGGDVNRSIGKLSFDSIRDSLQNLRANAPKVGEGKGKGGSGGGVIGRHHPMSLTSLKSSLNLSPQEESGRVIGHGTGLPASVFGKEMNEEGGKEDGAAMKTEFLKEYRYDELGEKLKSLRPKGVEKQKEGWFSLEELNERLVKLREIEENVTKNKFLGGTNLPFGELRKSLFQLSKEPADSMKVGVQRINIWNHLSASPDYLKHPPKEHLVEKYFHPDNMSASEKLKIELAKVREEFKMSESDCGSARVQVAQLTTKIKYLSKTLHKKDKHSRKGLIAMVQLRKKLLKYLRRTDWDSYCLLLDKLGLRDNPDIKMLAA